MIKLFISNLTNLVVKLAGLVVVLSALGVILGTAVALGNIAFQLVSYLVIMALMG